MAAKENWAPHVIPITIITAIEVVAFIVGAIILLVQKNSFIVRRKASQYPSLRICMILLDSLRYMVLTSVGLVFYIRDVIDTAWESYLECVGSRTFHL